MGLAGDKKRAASMERRPAQNKRIVLTQSFNGTQDGKASPAAQPNPLCPISRNFSRRCTLSVGPSIGTSSRKLFSI